MINAAVTAARKNHVGNGASTIFPFDFCIYDATQIQVLVGGIEKVLNLDYTIDAGSIGNIAGGNVTFLIAPANNANINFLRREPIQQQSDYQPFGATPNERVELDLDKKVMIDQMLSERIDRAISLKVQSILRNITIDDPVTGQLLRWADTSHIDSVSSFVTGGAIALPLSPANGGTGLSSASLAAALKSMGVLLGGGTNGGSSSLTPSGNVVTVPDPLTTGIFTIQAGGINTISPNTLPVGTEVIFYYAVGGNTIAANANLIMVRGAGSTWTTAIGDMSRFRYIGGNVWVEVERAPYLSPIMPRIGGYRGNANAGAPNTKRDMQADYIICHNPTNLGVTTLKNTGVMTNDTGVAGPAANGRDQAGAFGANNWIYFFYIMKPDGTVATLSSLSSTGPTLPSGYTTWAFADAVFYDAAPVLVPTKTRGSKVFISMGATAQLTAGVATVATQINIANFSPPNAIATKFISIIIVNFTGTTGDVLAYFGVDATVAATAYYARYDGSNQVLSKAQRGTAEYSMPGNQMWYLIVETGTTRGAAHGVYTFVSGYTIPNGGE